ncbi:MAG: ADP-ribosylglycohydrolase family protein [Candidatus Izemoplasmataceae bacterium]
MLGAIIGDIIGSRFEFDNHRSKDFELFTNDTFITDDTVMTLAVAKALLTVKETTQASNAPESFSYLNHLEKVSEYTIKFMQEYGKHYPDLSYGNRFKEWLKSSEPKPYNSYGNGAAMRVSSVAYVAKTLEEVITLSHAVTNITHNHPEGIKGAEAVAVAIFMALNDATMSEIEAMMSCYYTIPKDIDELRKTYEYNETSQDTVPAAIAAFLESHSFEDAVRNAISIGGDSNTLAAITGSIAEAYYGIPQSIKEKAFSYLDERLGNDYESFRKVFIKNSNNDFKVLTKYLKRMNMISNRQSITNMRIANLYYTKDYIDEVSKACIKDIVSFIKGHKEFEKANDYKRTLKEYQIIYDVNTVHKLDISRLDTLGILTLLVTSTRMQYWFMGSFREVIASKTIEQWLKRLAE